MNLKYRINITFLETRKIVESYMKDSTYANLAQKVCLISNNSNQPSKYVALIEK